MKIIRAEHLGMCFGVKDAIALALETARHRPLTVLGDLVHNETVLAELQAQGIRIRQSPEEIDTPTVMVTAHGASERRIGETRQRGLDVLEATCPLVHLAHRSLARLVGEGFYPVIVGKRDHVEVRGMTEDLDRCSVVLTADDVADLPSQPGYGVIAQTTQPIERVCHLVGLIRERFPAAEVRFIDTAHEATAGRGDRAGPTLHGGSSHWRGAQQQHQGIGGHLRPILPARASRTDRGGLAAEMVSGQRPRGTHSGHLHAGQCDCGSGPALDRNPSGKGAP
jgi:(E)-4-hydroxy-3-methyl-but-2-enyl pyrophosphate reductase